MIEEFDSMRMSKKKYESDRRYRKKTFESFSFISRKEDRLSELLEIGAKKRNTSKTNYIKDAVQSQLSRDGITIDMLPKNERLVIPEEPKPPKQCMVYLITSLYLTTERIVQEQYVTVLQTMEMAKKYVNDKFDKKPYPEEWLFTIYGKNIEANGKAEARVKLREMAKEAQQKVEDYLFSIPSDDDEDDDNGLSEADYPTIIGNRMISFTDMLWIDEFQPDCVEKIRYNKKSKKSK